MTEQIRNSCPYCGIPNDADKIFCTQCGAPLSAGAVPDIVEQPTTQSEPASQLIAEPLQDEEVKSQNDGPFVLFDLEEANRQIIAAAQAGETSKTLRFEGTFGYWCENTDQFGGIVPGDPQGLIVKKERRNVWEGNRKEYSYAVGLTIDIDIWERAFYGLRSAASKLSPEPDYDVFSSQIPARPLLEKLLSQFSEFRILSSQENPNEMCRFEYAGTVFEAGFTGSGMIDSTENQLVLRLAEESFLPVNDSLNLQEVAPKFQHALLCLLRALDALRYQKPASFSTYSLRLREKN